MLDGTEVTTVVRFCVQPPAKRSTGRGRVGGRPVTEQGVLRNLNKRKSARRGDDYDGALASTSSAAELCATADQHPKP